MKDMNAKELNSELLSKALGGYGSFCPVCGEAPEKEDANGFSCPSCGWFGRAKDLV